jgi:hypothetical protein
MKTVKFIIALFSFVGFMLVSCSDESQTPVSSIDQSSLDKVTITYHSGNDWPIQLIDPGTVIVQANRRITQHVIVLVRLETTNPLITGNMIADYSSNVDINTGEGHVHGSGTCTPDNVNVGGVWEFSFQGETTKTGESEWTTITDIVGHGKGGIIQSNQIFYNDNMLSWDSPTTFWYATGSGYMKSNEN